MKRNTFYVVMAVVVVLGMLLSACGTAAKLQTDRTRHPHYAPPRHPHYAPAAPP